MKTKVLFLFMMLATLVACEDEFLNEDVPVPTATLTKCYNSSTTNTPFVYNSKGDIHSFDMPEGYQGVEGFAKQKKMLIQYELNGNHAWIVVCTSADTAYVKKTEREYKCKINGNTRIYTFPGNLSIAFTYDAKGLIWEKFQIGETREQQSNDTTDVKIKFSLTLKSKEIAVIVPYTEIIEE